MEVLGVIIIYMPLRLVVRFCLRRCVMSVVVRVWLIFLQARNDSSLAEYSNLKQCVYRIVNSLGRRVKNLNYLAAAVLWVSSSCPISASIANVSAATQQTLRRGHGDASS